MKLDQTELFAAKCLLLDFDGPVCSVFAGYPAHQIAAELVSTVREIAPEVAADLEHEQDPMEVLRAAASHLPLNAIEKVNQQLDQAEVRAVRSAHPTPGAARLIENASRAGLVVAVVSNNGAEAIAEYLRDHQLAGYIATVVGRPFGRPDLMKPNPHLLLQALLAVDVDAEQSVFIGDSTTDVEAGNSARVRTIGFANKPGKEARLRDAGASLVVTGF